jgi:hypothetical protein
MFRKRLPWQTFFALCALSAGLMGWTFSHALTNATSSQATNCHIMSFTFAFDTIPGNAATIGRVTLNAPAPLDMRVNIRYPWFVQGPDWVTVPQGRASCDFIISTFAVNARSSAPLQARLLSGHSTPAYAMLTAFETTERRGR